MIETCEMESELHRQYPEASPGLRAHLATCEPCAREWREIELLGALARQVRAPARASAQLQRVRDDVVAGVFARARRRHALVVVEVVAIAAAATALLLLARAPAARDDVPGESRVAAAGGAELRPVATSRATLHPRASARVATRSPLPDEVIALEDGAMTVEVAPLAPGERFRVVTDDAEVEVRGTAFDVEADHGHLVAVHVWRGRVEVRAHGAPPAVLERDQTWARPARDGREPPPAPPPSTLREASGTPSPARAPAHASPPSAPPLQIAAAPLHPARPDARDAPEARGARSTTAPATPPARATTAATDAAAAPAALAFEGAWDAMRAGHPADAAAEFAHVPSSDPLGEDAMFWQGMALARAGRPRDAVRVLSQFLVTFAGSARRSEAIALLGWQALALGDLDAADARFRSLSGLPPTLQRNVDAGLAEVRRRRARAP